MQPVGSVIAIIMGIQAKKRAKLGNEAIEASGGGTLSRTRSASCPRDCEDFGPGVSRAR